MANTARPAFFHRGSTSFYGEFNATSIDMRFNFLDQYHRTSLSYHAILAFIVPALINLLQLKCQGDGETPFETHPKTMWVAINSLFLYCLLYELQWRFFSKFPSPTYADIAGHSVTLFGSLSLVSLASVLFPDSIRPVVYATFIVLSAGELLQLFCLINSLRQRSINSPGQRSQAFAPQRGRLPV